MAQHSFLQNLLQGQAVEWKTLGEVAVIGTGNSNRQDESENGDYPFYVRSKNVLRSDSYQFDETAIVIPGEGGVGDIFHYVEGKYALHQRAYRICIHDGDINTKFLYHVMRNSFKQYILSKSVGATATSIRKPMLEKFLIPIPPLSVQAKIVQILDTFTELTEQLTAELGMRQKQYQYYRNKLLTFDFEAVQSLATASDSERQRMALVWKTLGEVSREFGRGKSKHRPRNDERLYGGDIPFIQTGDIRGSAKKIKTYNQTYSDFGLAQSKLWKKDTLCITIAANIAETAILDFDACFPDSIIGFVADPKQVDVNYIYYLLQSLKTKLQSYSTGSAQENLNLAAFEDLLFPIPPLSEQARIVTILDTFDTLVNSISNGLPKEIKLRQQQYEYYRERLLGF
ncbi:Type I restriction-modification system, specificity subunit S [Moraxella catarrhalis RH4]|uniref:restriction endonuclease subunit S n=2 Tax=Moraxella catarrhalis TaxID=480 RepID=UPI0002A2D277|nr:restriction endonuclease subunit S [Moraxella catarrhalis]EKF83902.1 Type I restriction-modification system, specificity subunit S [Moraxella catarrhalis RH4]RKL83860.1 restriction endonuclease subunit S [Moraxella catarrhalis]